MTMFLLRCMKFFHLFIGSTAIIVLGGLLLFVIIAISKSFSVHV